jgi:hypothetical protein
MMAIPNKVPAAKADDGIKETKPKPDTALLGLRAPDRDNVDLATEAERLHFSDQEIRDLKRIYGRVVATNPKPKA